jgi:hypothetical protein
MESMLHGVSPEMTNQMLHLACSTTGIRDGAKGPQQISRHCNKGELDEHWAAEHTKQEDPRPMYERLA